MVNRSATGDIPAEIDIVIVGNGPSAMTLSYLLHGNVPYYNFDGRTPHFDNILDRKLAAYRQQPLYNALTNIETLCAHFEASGGYSRDAWPINVLLDTLIWPNAEMDPESRSTISYRYNERLRKDHIILGSAEAGGGQWANTDCHSNGENARTLSYAEQLSLPGYSFAEFYLDEYKRSMPTYERPRRPQVSAYYRAYCDRAGISDVAHHGTKVTSIVHTDTGYCVKGLDSIDSPFEVRCKHIVLACGLFSSMIDPPLMVSPYLSSSAVSLIHHKAPLVVIGSGFSAADAIVENLGKRPVIHLYKWKTAMYTSPLKYCHRSSYPEYADIYRRMKLSAQDLACFKDYRGFADTSIAKVEEVNGHFEISLAMDAMSGPIERVIAGEIVVLAGRRTSLDFLEPALLKELAIDPDEGWLEKSGLRHQITPKGPALTIDQGRIFCIGSITGDSLVRYSHGAIIGACMALCKHDRYE